MRRSLHPPNLGVPHPLGGDPTGEGVEREVLDQAANRPPLKIAQIHAGEEALQELKESDVYKNINFYLIDFPLNQAAFYATIVANCNEGIRSSYVDSVYENYDVWTKASSGEEIIELLNSYGLQHGLGDEELQSCLKDENSHNELLSLQVDAQNIFGVESTPTFLINGEKVQGNRPASEFIKIINKKLNN